MDDDRAYYYVVRIAMGLGLASPGLTLAYRFPPSRVPQWFLIATVIVGGVTALFWAVRCAWELWRTPRAEHAARHRAEAADDLSDPARAPGR